MKVVNVKENFTSHESRRLLKNSNVAVRWCEADQLIVSPYKQTKQQHMGPSSVEREKVMLSPSPSDFGV